MARLQSILKQLHEQVLFMASCGGTEAAYIRNYGTSGTYRKVDSNGGIVTVPNWSGDGGAAIYAADRAHLDSLYTDLKALTARRRNRMP